MVHHEVHRNCFLTPYCNRTDRAPTSANLSNTTTDFHYKSIFWIWKRSTSRLMWPNHLNYYLSIPFRSHEMETKVHIITLLCRQCHSSDHCSHILLLWHRNSPRLQWMSRNSWRPFWSKWANRQCLQKEKATANYNNKPDRTITKTKMHLLLITDKYATTRAHK